MDNCRADSTDSFINAFKYSPAGKEINVTAERLGDEVKISIRDKGIGIAEEHIKKIFTQFYRITGNENTIPGLGLGLYLCKKIAAYHGADIHVTDNKPQGSIFTVQF